MNIVRRIGAMVAAIVGAGALGMPIPGERRRGRRNKIANRKAVSYTAKLYAKQAAARLERYGLDVAGAKATVTDCRRRLRNARKLERQTPQRFGRAPVSSLQPCRVFWTLKTHGQRRKHMRGLNGCQTCVAFIRAEAKARAAA